MFGKIFYAFEFIITVLLSLYSVFFVIRYLFSLTKKQPFIPTAIENKRFALLIPARNEENTIGQLIESLQKLDYPKDCYDIYTLVNNSTDHTKQVALQKGSKVIEPTQVKCKADALRYAFDQLETSNYDYYVIFDADNLVDKQFLKEMNQYACAGYRVGQCQRKGKNTTDSWISGSYDFYYLTQNIFFNKARMATDNTASINGTGWMVAKSVIDEIGFPTVTLTEDVEFSGICAKHHIPIAYVEKAIVYDEYAAGFKVSWIQRKRWSTGSWQCFKHYYKDYLKCWWKEGNTMCLDFVLIYASPVFQLIATMLLLFNVTLTSLDWGITAAIIFTLLPMAYSYLSTVAFGVLVLLISKQSFRSYTPAILGFSIFLTSWALINIAIFVKKSDKWEPIAHTRSLSIDQMNQ